MSKTPRISSGELRIDDGWCVGNLTTASECDEANIAVTSQIALIERNLAKGARKENPIPDFARPEWRHKATTALRFKKATLQAIQKRRAQINGTDAESIAARRVKAEANQSKTGLEKKGRQINDTKRDLILDQLRDDYPQQFMASVSKVMAAYPPLWDRPGAEIPTSSEKVAS